MSSERLRYCDLVEPLDRGLDPLPPSLVLIDCLSAALKTPCMGEAEHPYHRGEQQSLANQCHEDDGKRQEENQFTPPGKGWPSAVANGIASAAASETMPRTPVKASTNGHCQGGDGSLRLIGGRASVADRCGIHPDESRHDHHGTDDGGGDGQLG